MEIKEQLQPTTEPKEKAAAKKKKPPQISLTFKMNSPIEMDLYDHLQKKFYQGAYIKELLINNMLKERPDLAEKYNYTLEIEPPKAQPIIEHTMVHIPEDDEPEEEQDEIVQDTQPVNDGLGTLGAFILK